MPPLTLSPLTSLTLSGLLVLALAACATAPAPDLTPPPPPPYDAKTQLEYGGAPRPPRP